MSDQKQNIDSAQVERIDEKELPPSGLQIPMPPVKPPLNTGKPDSEPPPKENQSNKD